MEQNLKDQEVLLVKEPQKEKLSVVSGLDESGNLKTVPPKAEHTPDFMKIDKHSNVLENFFSNFLRQAKDPTHFNFFKVPAENVDAQAYVLGDMLKDPDNPSNRAELEDVRVDPLSYKQSQEQASEQKNDTPQGYKPYDESRIDWKQFEQIGVSKEQLEKSGALEQMLNYRKSPTLMDINATMGDATIRTQGRLSMRETDDGRIVPVIHAIRKQPELERPFYGHSFTAEDKENLLKTGNLGRVVELTNRSTNDKFSAFVSIDKQTNELVALRADRIKIPNEIKGVPLNDEQKKSLSEGKELYVEGMTAKSGKSFSAHIQFNADKRGVEFRFPEQQQQQPQKKTQNQAPQNGFRIPTKLGERQLSPEEQQKLKDGGTIYVQGLKDRKGQEYNAYIKVNDKEQKLDFYKWNPDKSKEVAPDNASKTQVAVNSEGKTNEATKEQKEPLEQGQTQANEQQQNKPRGMKM